MSYQAKYNGGRSEKNNEVLIRTASSAASATPEPTAATIGAAVTAANQITGGKLTGAAGKAAANVIPQIPGEKNLKKRQDDFSASGLPQQAVQAAAVYNGANNAPKQATVQGDNKRSQTPGNSNGDQEFDGEGSGSANGLGKKIAAIAIVSVIGFIFIFIIIIAATTTYAGFEDALGASYASGEETGSFTDFSAVTEEAEAFYERINAVKLEYAIVGKKIEAVQIVAVYHIMVSENNNFTYRDMTKAKIRDIASAMFKGNEYDVAVFEENLVNEFFKKQFPEYNDEKRKSMAKRVIQYIEDYYSFLGKTGFTCTELGSCFYQIKGFYYPNASGNAYLNKPLEFNNLKVRLMQTGYASGHDYGGTFGEPMPDEYLIPFEEYVMGVAYFEIGDSHPDEAIKAQLVAARSFALSRPHYMGKWRTLKEEADGQWVLQIANSTTDQGFCNPSLGCSAENPQWGQIYSGHRLTAWQKAPLSETSKLRSLALEVIGEVLVNEEGNIIHTGYNSTTQHKMIDLANEGYDYKQILLEVYNNVQSAGAAGIDKMTCTTAGTSSCNSETSGPYAQWKQYEGPWIHITLGNSGKSIKRIGCAATSVAILIAKSGVPTTVDLNPGTFVQTLNANNGFGSGSCLGCIKWASASYVAPTFQYTNSLNLSGYSKDDKFNTLKSLLDQGYYVTAEVKGNTGEHWVAIDSIQGNEVRMMDPGSTSTNLWDTYPWYNTSKFVYYKVV